ncbi:acyltransferase family protein [Vibrio lentus]|nr:acyltransferase family protein [Vibrio lentus]
MAVIAIHVLAPYRNELRNYSFQRVVNGNHLLMKARSRWAVPVFILISGALMLSDQRPFDAKYYLKRRLGKVLIPFIVWSLFYTYLSGWSAMGFDADVSWEVLLNSCITTRTTILVSSITLSALLCLIPFLNHGQKVWRQSCLWLHGGVVVHDVTVLAESMALKES